MEQLGAILLWLLLTVGILIFSIVAYLMERQYIAKSQRFFSGFFPFTLNFRTHGTRVFFASLPSVWISSLIWPAMLAVSILWRIQLLGLSQSDFKQAVFLRASNSNVQPLISCGAIIAISSMTTMMNDHRILGLAWLLCIWIGLACWLLSSYIPGNSIEVWVRRNPNAKWRSLLALLALFTLAFPFVSSLLTVMLGAASSSFADVIVAMKNIYSLGGALWEGPKYALTCLSAEWNQAFQLCTGSLLYLVVFSNIYSIVKKPISKDELLTAARWSLTIGDNKRAGELIDQIPGDEDEIWATRITYLTLKGDVDKASLYCSAKFPELSDYGTKLNVLSTLAPLSISLIWKVPSEIQERIWSNFLLSSPAEEELFFLWVGLLSKYGRDSQADYYSTERFLAAAKDKGYTSLELFILIHLRQLDDVKRLHERLTLECSLSPAARYYYEVITIGIEKARILQPDIVKANIQIRFESLAAIRPFIRSICGLLVATFALKLLVDSFGLGDEYADCISKELSGIEEKVLLYPNGQQVFVSLRSVFSAARPTQ